MQHSAFELSQNDLVFQTKADLAAMNIQSVIASLGLEEDVARRLKIVSNAIVKTGIIRRAPGHSVLDKITAGVPQTLMSRITGIQGEPDQVNERARAIFIGFFCETPHFSASRLIEGLEQNPDFLREQSKILAVMNKITSEINRVWSVMVQSEDWNPNQMKIYREFENEAIEQFYDWQLVDDPFEDRARKTADMGYTL